MVYVDSLGNKAMGIGRRMGIEGEKRINEWSKGILVAP
jgi:hypothetical protein